jgi:transcriptional regulator GlxA family with amidase domain
MTQARLAQRIGVTRHRDRAGSLFPVAGNGLPDRPGVPAAARRRVPVSRQRRRAVRPTASESAPTRQRSTPARSSCNHKGDWKSWPRRTPSSCPAAPISRSPIPDAVLDAVRQAAAGGTRIASICTGAFILAATGLLDGHRATTHWLATDRLAELHPAIEVDPNVLYVDNGQFLTSAGAAAGLDLCLHLIRRGHGSAVAAHAARLCVMPLEREGGQAQFIVHDLPPTPRGSILEPVLRWVQDNSHVDLTLADIAEYVGMSTRTLNRRFREQTDMTPLQWLHRARIRQAQYLLEATDHPVDRIARQVGFSSPTAFRDHFKRIVGTSPHGYRSAFH